MSEFCIIVPNANLWRRVPGKGFVKLLREPKSRRMSGDCENSDLAPCVAQGHTDVVLIKTDRRNGAQIPV